MSALSGSAACGRHAALQSLGSVRAGPHPGRARWPEYIGDYTLACLLGIAFQFFAIVPMRHLGVGTVIREAVEADTLSPAAFEVGLFGWMALMAFAFFHPALHPDRAVYRFMMRIGMLIGFATSYPMNWALVRHGVKEGMEAAQ